MGAVVPIIGAVAAVASAGAAVMSATKSSPTVTAPAVVQQNPNNTVTDALLRRRGTASNQVTGSGGAESQTAAKKSFMGS